jgi:DNA topoisomerase-1
LPRQHVGERRIFTRCPAPKEHSLKKLVIVESPAKAKTIEKFLGGDYKVVASYGHVRDLPTSASETPEEIRKKPWGRLAVDTSADFTPYYVVPDDKQKRVSELRKQVKDAEEILLATDEDREGESISWHLLSLLNPKVPVRRITFNEITKDAILGALRSPRDMDDRLVRAQEGCRILDRLFGYELSPVLWKKVRTGLSAGRVQSVALRLVVEREEERMAFRGAEYWDIEARFRGEGIEFTGTLVSHDGRRIATGKDFDPQTGGLKSEGVDKAPLHLREDDARSLAQAALAARPWRVASVEEKEAVQRPYPPFTTSTMQQAASSALGMSLKRTMSIAQKLYEGVDTGNGQREGLITYMRTDSVTLSERAIQEAGEVIRKEFGDNYYEGPRRYRTSSKMAQEAHEAIRPTHLALTPDQLAHALDKDELALYDLIWRRTLASQMADARLAKTAADIAAGASVFRVNGSVVRFPGFLKVFNGSQKDVVVPHMEEGQLVGPGQRVEALDALPKRHETTPPARYTEASLVKKLEEEGIGRPSTYASIITTIQQRDYVGKRGAALVPTFTGMAVTHMLRDHFGEFVDIKFTARMEDALDEIASGNLDWVDFLRAFYRGGGDFGHGLHQTIEHELPKIEFPAIEIGADPATGETITVRVGRTAPFLQRGGGGDGNTATVPADTPPDELTVEKASEILAARAFGRVELGASPDGGETVYLCEGPLGPYVQLGEGDKKKKPRRASVPQGVARDTVTLPDAMKWLSLPRELGAHPDSGLAVAASVGRFGPYVVHNGDFRSLREGDDVYTVTLERALELLAQPKARRSAPAKKSLKDLGAHPESGKGVAVMDGRYGPYVTDGAVNATLPKGADPMTVTMEQAVQLLAAAAEKKGTGTKRGGKRTGASPRTRRKA